MMTWERRAWRPIVSAVRALVWTSSTQTIPDRG